MKDSYFLVFVCRLVAQLQHEVSMMKEFTLLVGGPAGISLVGVVEVSE